MIPSHPVTQFNQGAPLRQSPTQAVCPHLHEVTLRETLTRGIISGTSGVNLPGTIKEGQEFLRLIESSDNTPAPRRDVCVPDTATFQPVLTTLAEIATPAAVCAKAEYIRQLDELIAEVKAYEPKVGGNG